MWQAEGIPRISHKLVLDSSKLNFEWMHALKRIEIISGADLGGGGMSCPGLRVDPFECGGKQIKKEKKAHVGLKGPLNFFDLGPKISSCTPGNCDSELIRTCSIWLPKNKRIKTVWKSVSDWFQVPKILEFWKDGFRRMEILLQIKSVFRSSSD